ncbi:hypothetical protein SPRG_21653 [Saprolegnia parasitica CBS 223.65]|uniref:SWIM-type domain-containing protein n=1 Tax=Saprolegnia parasitica (strain CBS 223.65) TaxID=695850 RepID=A0A067BKC2_SAPPC|nr:hypothetical protein SPRG_21653 [Saprolegnia parasitica CBS 223.65]KDO18638.1 hypothetical protein SPRG_21653 [Saprolegnia parasitica CBS 223.65]|eukprot:XP_012210661.1 hypothetical protein SPRG_21653 [Saprolegnia parasitica CBS 223.65]
MGAPRNEPRYSQRVQDNGVDVFTDPVRRIGAMRTNILGAAQVTQHDWASRAAQAAQGHCRDRDDGSVDTTSCTPMIQIGLDVDADSDANEDLGRDEYIVVDPNVPVVHCPDGYVDLAASLGIICLDDDRSIKPTKTKFETYDDLKDRVQLLAALNLFQVSKEHQSSMRKIRCRSDKCQFLVQANVGKKGISVTLVCLDHNHSLPHSTPMPPGSRNTTVSTDMLVKFANELDIGHTLVREELIRAVRDKFGISISSSRVTLVKKVTKKRQLVTIKDQFAKLESYLEKLVEANPGMYAAFTKTGSSFHGAFCVPACFRKDAKSFLLPIVFLDACHMKDDMHEVGTLLSATSKDGNGNIVPIAFALVQGELVDTWDWFCAHLALASSYPRFVAVADYMSNIPVEHWVTYTFIPVEHWVTYTFIRQGIPTFDATTSNVAESSNNWLGADLRSSDPVGVFCFYLNRLNKTFNDRLDMHSKSSDILTNKEAKAFEALSIEARKCTVTDLRTNHSFTVLHSKHRTPDKARFVNVTAKTCQCGAWQDHLKPCMHAIAVAMYIGAEPLTWYHTAYSRKACISLYSNPLVPLPPQALSMDDDMIVESYDKQIKKRGAKGGKRRRSQFMQ